MRTRLSRRSDAAIAVAGFADIAGAGALVRETRAMPFALGTRLTRFEAAKFCAEERPERDLANKRAAESS